ncbi:hypothetical protein FEM48_Zijuj09G0147900 [Ziziphus jujuba var. spinosa]|uniref:Uncharacterized protein n=1 Tax=Ziziphus jujuba var. spinosa TaxID=714518 RepID=A0A978UTL5_ZIZJJ|nr:hypothetical protein FEM48_Zijuj09G0147900 [Ziziphus jujuba var. spinosa]
MFFFQPWSMGFAIGGRTFFLWGGCMMAISCYLVIKCCIFCSKLKFFFFFPNYVMDCLQMHADDFRHDYCGVVSSLKDGGYSDDMTLAAIAGAHKSLITSPLVAVFPHPLARDLSFSRYWNYLRKQTFVLESYATKVNWVMNRALFTSHCYLSWGFVALYVMGMIHITSALRIFIKGYTVEETMITSGGEHPSFLF